MVKKLLLTSVFSFLAFGTFAQTIVSTTPEDKKVVLEEFTGINCVFCPDGHQIAQGIATANPGNVFLINIHTGGFATPGAGQPDFRSPFGPAIASQSGLVGYPAGTVNRHIFPGQSQSGNPNDTAMSRGQWSAASNTILGQASYVNMAVEAEIDVTSREVTVHVEAYYTGNSPEATNKLNVALLQNNTLGPQTGGNMGNNYVHQHRLVHLITGQWGLDVTTTSATDFVDETLTYTIPANYNGVPAVLEDMELVVFMTETTQELISGNGAMPTFVNLPNDNDAQIVSDAEFDDQCGIAFSPTVTIQNRGNNPLTSLAITYDVNGGTSETYNWTGNLGPFESEDVVLDPIAYTIQSTNTVNISIPNDDDNTNNSATNTFGEITDINSSALELRMNLDENGSEVTWAIIDSNLDVVESGGPYAANEQVDIEFGIPDADCFRFILTDAGGDGEYFVRLRDANGDIIVQNIGVNHFGDTLEGTFRLDGVLSIGDAASNAIAVYPNPASQVLNVRNAANGSVEIFDILGKRLIQMDNISTEQQINVASLQAGTYLIKITNGASVQTEKFVIAR
ncbi:T9SS type A sorting domain-containing protein [Rasiella rasia]|uniref:T9SS type A sorting domain-containing protein n=1 Tax=Rasiella rasia TaxID=2744027 RepID=A0A6G6GPA9_9FLAO|nr:Omp28-related outer membrane protein [Rasiella rasia]QIE60435.1 T9SS type A sorting domain-containing protein [Rasiella rasia]